MEVLGFWWILSKEIDTLTQVQNLDEAVCISYSANKSKVGSCSRGRPEDSLFNSYYTEV